jgi:hypothetical protein
MVALEALHHLAQPKDLQLVAGELELLQLELKRIELL